MYCRFSFVFWHPYSNLPDGWDEPDRKFTRGLIAGRTPKIHSDIWRIPSVIFTGGEVEKESQKCEIGLDFRRHTLAFEALWFQNGATYKNHKTFTMSAGDCTSFWLRHFDTLPPLFTGSQKVQNFALFGFEAFHFFERKKNKYLNFKTGVRNSSDCRDSIPNLM